MKEVQPGVQVEVAYTLRADGPEGEELESCNEETPFVFTVGQEEALEAFEAALIGKRVGEPFEIQIACDDAYGDETDDAVVFAHQTPEEAGKWKDSSVFHVGDGSSDPIRLGVVIGEFHNRLMDRMLEDARVSAAAMGGTIDQVVWVPGTYEAPLVVERMLEDDALDAVCVVGYIEKGSTLHGQEMGATCSLIFKQLELEYGKPVGMGIIGPGATAEQAEGRVAYAGNAIRASIRMARYMAKK